jgi:hypothetical protein
VSRHFDTSDSEDSTAPARTSKRRRAIARTLPRRSRPYALFGVKAFHSLAFWVIQTAIFYLLYKGVRRESDRRAAAAFAIATGEVIVYAGNGFRCPLTGLAEELGAERGSVTDIFLPSWLARNVANIYTPLFALAVGLHARNVWASEERPGTRTRSIVRTFVRDDEDATRAPDDFQSRCAAWMQRGTAKR